jgi:hypothetical protein
MNWIHANPIWFAAIVTGLHHALDAMVDSLPAPQPLSSPGYQFFYAFANKFAGNYRKKES